MHKIIFSENLWHGQYIINVLSLICKPETSQWGISKDDESCDRDEEMSDVQQKMFSHNVCLRPTSEHSVNQERNFNGNSNNGM